MLALQSNIGKIKHKQEKSQIAILGVTYFQEQSLSYDIPR